MALAQCVRVWFAKQKESIGGNIP